MERKTSWVCTIITQLSLCFALYIALNLGQPQKFIKRSGNSRINDLYFISVNGGFRPVKQQFDILKQMAKVAKTYKASFVLNSSELGEDDPLRQNATENFSSLRVPWYATYTATAPKEHTVGCFEQKIKISNGKTLDIIGVDTKLLQDTVLKGSSGMRNSQLHWLIKTLEASTSDWHIVVGSQPLVLCQENEEHMEKKQVFEYLHRIFLKFSVNVYLSGQDCTNHVQEGGVTYIGNPGLFEKQRYSVFQNGNSAFSGELANGFLLHRISSMQIVIYYITSAGEVAFKTVLQHKGREVM